MKILFSAYHNPCFETITEYCERALRTLGHDVIPFEDRAFVLPGRVRSAFPALGAWDLSRMNDRFVSVAQSQRADLCVVIGGHRILPRSVFALRAAGVKTVLWTIDPPLDFAPVAAHAGAYDKVFCGGSEAQEILAVRNVTSVFLPFGYDAPSLSDVTVTDEERVRFGSDVCFVGSHYPNRERLFSALVDRGVRVAVWGPGWDKVAKGSPLAACVSHAGSVLPSVWQKVLAASKMTIVAHYHDEGVPCHQVSPKVYEAMACGCMVLCDRQEDAKTLFVDKETIVFYDDADDARAKIVNYLAHDGDRRRIAGAAQALVREKHTYVRRMEELLRSVYGA